MKLKSLLLLLITLSVSTLFSQTFTNNREKFVKEFEKSLTDFGKGEFSDFAKKNLPQMLLETSDFPESYFTKMVETCNLMTTKNLKPYPEIYQYVFSVYSFVKGRQSINSYKAWHSSVDKLLDGKNIKKFEDFIELSAGFFSERKISDASNFIWFYEGGEYAFEFTDKPFINCKGGNLICRVVNRNTKTKDEHPYSDSVVVFNTSGTYDPVLKRWDGNGGIVTWQKVGLSKDETNASLKNYDVSCKTPNFNADSVLLKTKYFANPIMGAISDRAFTINREEDRIYPQFLSYEKRLIIKNIKPDVDYDGGFSMQGASFVGMGTPKEPAKMLLYRNGKVFVKAAAQIIYIYPTRISSNNSSTALYLNSGDSITHPGCHFGYDMEKKIIEFTRTKTGNGMAPFGDSYHQLDMYVAKMTWKTEDQDVYFTYDFGTSQEQRMASFESKAYFDERLYDRLQGLESVHPLQSLWKYCYKYDEFTINEGKAASALSKTIEQARPILIDLSTYGFINYDLEAQTVTINPKLDHFVQGKAKRKDYDYLTFVSDFRPKELKGYTEDQIKEDKNLQAMIELYAKQAEERRLMTYFGKMNLGTLELDLNAVDAVTLSDKQFTKVFPQGSRVVVKQNRNFEFSGWVNSGKIEVQALSANFNYNDNKINLLKTYKSLLRVRPLKPEDGNKVIAMRGTINGITGELLVDDPKNRSGNNADISTYPKLIIAKNCFVYYNSKTISRGVYDSSRFYYTVFPFEIDSMDNFNELSFHLKGELTSAGIFPKIMEDLVIMPDYSFGFSTKAPQGGYDFYGTGAKYENKILLSNNGLQGAGTINFVESTSISKALYFMPDSTVGYASFVNKPIEAGVQFPDVESKEAYICYVPRDNLLKASSTPTMDLNFFKGEAKLRGTALIRPNGMTGKGMFSFKTATTISEKYRFSRWEINADTSSFSLKNTFAEEGEGNVAFQADNVQAKISFKERNGEFKSNKGTSQVNFPINQYMCRMDRFSWFMDYAELQLDKAGEKDITIETDMDMVGPNFYSLHPDQDSLSFRVPKAKYDLKQRSIFCEQVKYLDVADARIFPDSMKMVIRRKAKIDPLKNSQVVANYITQYHKFVQCEIDILARLNFQGTGTYPYYDRDSTLTNFFMERIFVDSTHQTEAVGKIAQDAQFYLSKQFDYYGDVTVKASLPTIIFTGATRINHTCEKFPRKWISFSAKIDPNNIQIPIVPDMVDFEGNPISSGIVWRNSPQTDSIRLYPVFLSPKAKIDDQSSMSVSGLLQYNPDAKEFQIGSKEKLLNRGEKGDFLSLHTETCSLHGEGKINIGMDFGDVTVDAVGTADYDQTSGKTAMNLTARFNFPIDKGLMEEVANRINVVEGLKPMDLAATTFEQALVEWTDQRTADRIKSDYTIKGEIKKMPEAVEKTMTITGLKLISFDKISNQERGLVSVSPTAVLLNIYEKPVVKYVPLKVFFQQNYSEAAPDKFGLQIDIPGGRDYYFDYSMVKKDGEMRIISGDTDFTAAIDAIKEEKRKTKNFKYETSTQRIYLSKFLRFFE